MKEAIAPEVWSTMSALEALQTESEPNKLYRVEALPYSSTLIMHTYTILGETDKSWIILNVEYPHSYDGKLPRETRKVRKQARVPWAVANKTTAINNFVARCNRRHKIISKMYYTNLQRINVAKYAMDSVTRFEDMVISGSPLTKDTPTMLF
jgi:hypothetical protein